MSDSVDFRAVKKKSYTEKDFYVFVTIELSRLYVNKENSQEHVWTDPPKTWDEARLGPWRSPTGKSKDSLPTLKKKCDFLLQYMPKEKEEKANTIKSWIELAKTDNKALINNIVCLLHQQESLKKLHLHVETNINSTTYDTLVHDTKLLYETEIKKLDTILQTQVLDRKTPLAAKTMTRSRKRTKKHCGTINSNIESPKQKCYRNITPRLSLNVQPPQNTAHVHVVTTQPTIPLLTTLSTTSSPTTQSAISSQSSSHKSQAISSQHSPPCFDPYLPLVSVTASQNIQEEILSTPTPSSSPDSVLMQEQNVQSVSSSVPHVLQQQESFDDQILSVDSAIRLSDPWYYDSIDTHLTGFDLENYALDLDKSAIKNTCHPWDEQSQLHSPENEERQMPLVLDFVIERNQEISEKYWEYMCGLSPSAFP